MRAVQRRRNVDELTLRLSLDSAEQGWARVARDGGEVIGIAIAHDSESERLVGDLFVEPSYRGQGIGRRLLQALFEDGHESAHAITLDSGDHSALALGLRFGLAPRELIARFAGAIPREEELARMAAGDYRFAVETIDAATHGFVLNELDRPTRGTARPADHMRFARSATGCAFLLNGECVGYVYVWPDGRIGPFACASEGYLVQILAYALVTLSRTHAASWCTALVPLRNRRIARAALRAGLEIGETFWFASEPATADFSNYVGYHRLLF